MRKTIIFILSCICAILCYFTFMSAGKLFRSDWKMPVISDQKQAQYRLVLITQELETLFWNKVRDGALEEAQKDGASLEVWGSYNKNQEDFLKEIEIAIDSKVDGIIVQGLDTDEFKNLTKIKAAFYGIPIITVANDVPMAESLRRTYVGSNQYLAGQMIAKQLITDMGEAGSVILMGDNHQEFYQEQRLNGIQDVLKNYPNVRTEYAETAETIEQITTTTQDLMNRLPDVDAFIAINANIASAMLQEIGRRTKIEPYYIYSFDDGPESLSLLKKGKLDGIIEQAPDMIGKTSVNLMLKWLRGETVPLNMNGYLTDIRMLKAVDAQ
ncbi:sugar ABC transporter substrate-binding protein [Paenibacillus psychroresistens]|uniref:Sugar ABC transporter substrate-binding protein n=1 Tax=Paenibacillus psychroresistens TaxID=1778678 RepID=A0A6B8RG71_9BACL|nr:substrate-binding domain-containing protein [Paenibacillus psychroresistens]QGQ94523.1 sugar ABC transporter substrate-binding protein [Paenibacillus psychroresistens]